MTLIVGCAKPIDESTLIEKNGLLYVSNSESPFSGEAFGYYASGEKVFSVVYESGKQVGDYTFYKRDGSKKVPVNMENMRLNKETFREFFNRVPDQSDILNGWSGVGLIHSSDTNEPYSGPVFTLNRNGEKELEGTLIQGRTNGRWTLYWDNGQKRREVFHKNGLITGEGKLWSRNNSNPYEIKNYENGLLHGNVTRYYSNTRQKSQTYSYNQGEFHGLFTGWDETGVKRTELNYENGYITFPYNFFNEQGELIEPVNYDELELKYGARYLNWNNSQISFTGRVLGSIVDGKGSFEGLVYKGHANGTWTYYYESGAKENVGVFVDDNRYGVWTWWYENGQKKEASRYENDVAEGLTIKWFENGQKSVEGWFNNDKKDSTFTWWYESGQKKEESTFKNDKFSGLSTFWYENGNVESKGHFLNDKKDGVWTWWYENGQKKEESIFLNDAAVGFSKTWYENGQKSSEGWFKHGKQDSAWTFWYENGQKSSESVWNDGDRNGVFTYWYENGIQKEVKNWINNTENGVWTQWDEKGAISIEKTYRDGKEINSKKY